MWTAPVRVECRLFGLGYADSGVKVVRGGLEWAPILVGDEGAGGGGANGWRRLRWTPKTLSVEPFHGTFPANVHNRQKNDHAAPS